MDKKETIELLANMVDHEPCIARYNAMEIRAFDARGNKIYDDALIATMEQLEDIKTFFVIYLACKIGQEMPDTFDSVTVSLCMCAYS